MVAFVMIGILAATWSVRLAAVSGGDPSFETLFAFGDSLTDTGRDAAPEIGYYKGRYSNGPLWVEYLSEDFGILYRSEHNLAESGDRTDGLWAKVQAFSPPPDTDLSRALVVAWAGGNDFIQKYDENLIDPVKWEEDLDLAVSNLTNAVMRLHNLGFQHLLIPNTVDVSAIPTFNWLPGEYREFLRGQVREFNKRLWNALDTLQSSLPEAHIYRADIYQRTNEVLSEPEMFGFTETEVGALQDFTLFDKRFNGPGRNYVFWDPIHPTTKAHRLIADWFREEIARQSHPGPHLAAQREQNHIRLEAQGLESGSMYRVGQSNNLREWTWFQSFEAVSDHWKTTLPIDSTRRFYALQKIP